MLWLLGGQAITSIAVYLVSRSFTAWCFEVMIEIPLNCITLAWSIWNELVLCGVYYLGGFSGVIFYFTSALQTDLCCSTCVSAVTQLAGDKRDFPGVLWSA